MSERKRYNINGKFDIIFEPDNPEYVKRLCASLTTLDELQGTIDAVCGKETDHQKIHEVSSTCEAKMREIIDAILGAGCCQTLYGGTVVWALSDRRPLWANLMLSLFEQLTVPADRRTKGVLKKYKRKRVKK